MLRTIVKLQSTFLLAVVKLKATSGTVDHVTTDNEITNQTWNWLIESAGKLRETTCGTCSKRGKTCSRWKARENVRGPTLLVSYNIRLLSPVIRESL